MRNVTKIIDYKNHVFIESDFQLPGFKKFVREVKTWYEQAMPGEYGEKREWCLYQIPPEKVAAALWKGGRYFEKTLAGLENPCYDKDRRTT